MMGESLLQICLLAIGVLEVVLCYAFVSRMLTIREKQPVWVVIVLVLGIMCMGLLLSWHRNVLFFDKDLWVRKMILCSVWLVVLLRKRIIEVIELVVVYYNVIAMLDFFFAYLVMGQLQEQFWNQVYFMTLTWWSILIYAFARGCVLTLVLLLYRYLPKDFVLRGAKVVLLFVAAGLCMLVYFYHLLLWHLAETVPYVSVQSICISVLTILAILCVAMLLFFREKAVRKEKDILLVKSEVQERQFREVQAVTEKNYGLVHDMKNHIIVLQELAQKEDMDGVNAYLKKLSTSNISALTHHKWTGCYVLDILLNQKQRSAQDKGIKFEVRSNGTVQVQLSEMELVSLFGNLLDNAIEACLKLPEKERRIDVFIEQRNTILFVKITNSVLEVPIIVDGQIVSTKADNVRHGYGLKNVRRILEEHGGQMAFRCEDQMFSVCVNLFDGHLSDEKKK